MKNPGQVVAVLNQKGGVGKTTMTYNLAFALQQMKQKVLCIDLDPQANLSLLFENIPIPHQNHNDHHNHRRPFHVFDLLINSLRELKMLHQPVLLNDVLIHKEGVDLLPSGSELSGLELTVASLNSPRQLILKKFLEKSGILDHYDFILIDAPPTLGLIIINILCSAQKLLIPFAPDQFSHHGLMNLHQTLEDVCEMEIVEGPRQIGYIPNLVEGRRKQEELDFQAIEEFLKGHKIFRHFTNRVQLVKSNSQRKSVFSYQNKEYKEIQQQFNEIAQWLKE